MADKVILEQTDVTVVENNGMLVLIFQESLTLTNGVTYRVIFNDVEHRCVAVAATFGGTYGVGIGNFSLAAIGDDTGEPFLIGVAADGSASGFTSDTTKPTHTIAIYEVVDEDKWLLIKESTLVATADAIRETLSTEVKISPINFPAKIKEIASSGGGSADVRYVTFKNGDDTLWVKPVAVGDDCVDVYTKGLIEKPTKESTVQYDYDYLGWSATEGGPADSTILQAVTEDKTVYAAYKASTRRYNICFYDGDTLLSAMQVAYGSTPAYTTEKEGYNFEGWSPEIVPVTGDANYYAQWSSALTFAGASWADIARISEAGEAASTFKVGDTRTEIIGGNTVTLTIVDFNADIQSDGTTVAGMTIISAEQYSSNYYNIEPGFNGDWGKSGLFTNVNNIYNSMSPELQAVVKTVRKKYCAYNSSGASGTIDSKVWIPSVGEIGYKVSPSNSKYVFSTAHRYLDRPYAITEVSPRFFVPTSSDTYDSIFTRTMCDYSSSYTPYQYWAIVPFTATSGTPYIKEQYYNNKGRIRIGFCV